MQCKIHFASGRLWGRVCVSIEDAAREVFCLDRVTFHEGSQTLGNDVHLIGFEGAFGSVKDDREPEQLEKMINEAKEAAKAADIVVMPIGEHFLQSGEATSRAMIDIPDVQMELFREIVKINSNIVVVLFNGRPLDLREISKKARAVLEVWLPGTEGGHAIVDTLIGKSNPSGRLPMSFPYCVGQVPVFYNEYNTGRPYKAGIDTRFSSKYIDIPNEPLYPFGYGLSYTSYETSKIQIDRSSMGKKDKIKASVCVKNKGDRAGIYTAQLYIRDLAASCVRPVRELKGIQKIEIEPGEEKEVFFEIREDMLRFHGANNRYDSEPGKFIVWIGEDSRTDNGVQFILKE